MNIIKYRVFRSRFKPGVVLVSTGVLKSEEPSAVRVCVKKRNLNINANDKYAFAA